MLIMYGHCLSLVYHATEPVFLSILLLTVVDLTVESVSVKHKINVNLPWIRNEIMLHAWVTFTLIFSVFCTFL